MRRIRTLIIGVVLACCVPAVVWAEANDAVREQARQRFVQGVDLIEQERWEEGLAAFEESYRAYPTQAALFNRALCLRLLRRYAEAMAALADYRNRYADQVGPDRMAEVEEELRTIREIVGRVNVTLAGASAGEVYVDGRRMSAAPTFRAIVVSPGPHEIEVRAAGLQTYHETVTLRSGQETTVRATMRAAVADASIVLTVNVDGAAVALDGANVGTTPLDEAIPASGGNHTLEVTRSGYERSETTVSVTSGQSTNTDVRLQPLRQLPPAMAGQLEVAVNPADAEVVVDDLPFTGGQLPIGPHYVVVRREGMRDFSENIEVTAGQAVRLEVQLVPGTAGGAVRQSSGGLGTLLLAGIITGAAGVALAGVGFGLYGWNSGRHDDWEWEDWFVRSRLQECDIVPDCGYDVPVLEQRRDDNDALGEEIDTMNVVSWVLVGVGAAAIAAGVTLIVIGARRRVGTRQVSLLPGVQPGGGSVQLGVSF